MKEQRRPELITDLEYAWLSVLRKALAGSASSCLRFETVNVREGRVWAERVIETFHGDTGSSATKTK